MKHLVISCSILLALLAAVLLNARVMDGCVEAWRAELDGIRSCAQSGDWPQAADKLDALRADWTARHPLLHLVVPHGALDQADALFERAAVFARAAERVEFLAETAELIAQLETIQESQTLSFRNVF